MCFHISITISITIITIITIIIIINIIIINIPPPVTALTSSVDQASAAPSVAAALAAIQAALAAVLAIGALPEAKAAAEVVQRLEKKINGLCLSFPRIGSTYILFTSLWNTGILEYWNL